MRTTTTSKKSLADQAGELVEQVTPYAEAARERIVNDYLPVAQSMLAEARDTAREVAQDARVAAQEAAANAEKSTRKSRKKAAKRARAKAGTMAAAAAAAAPAVAAPLANKAADKLQPKPKRRKRFVLLLGLIGAAAVAFKKMRSQNSAGSSYSPPRPAPAPRPTPVPEASTPPAPPDMHFEPDADPLTDPLGDPATTDAGGASPDELLADADEQPHAVTTPGDPAEAVDVSEGRRSKG